MIVFAFRLCHIVCLQLHVILSMGGRGVISHFKRGHTAPNAVAYIATSQKGMACTPRDPKCGRFFFVFLDFGQIFPPAMFGQPWPAKAGGGGGVQPTQPRLAGARNTPFGVC